MCLHKRTGARRLLLLCEIKSVFHKILADEEVDRREDHCQDESRYKYSVEVHETVRGVLQIYEQREQRPANRRFEDHDQYVCSDRREGRAVLNLVADSYGRVDLHDGLYDTRDCQDQHLDHIQSEMFRQVEVHMEQFVKEVSYIKAFDPADDHSPDRDQ